MALPNKESLPPARRQLLEFLQRVNFGRLESLTIRGGQPVFNPLPTIIREHKFGGDNGPRPELAIDDFLLKRQVVELFAFLDELQDGVIHVLEVKHGLPFRVIVGEAAA
jgi:hypothetical protein